MFRQRRWSGYSKDNGYLTVPIGLSIPIDIHIDNVSDMRRLEFVKENWLGFTQIGGGGGE